MTRMQSAKRDESAKRDRWALVGNACHDAIVFFVFYVHQMDAKILIGQNSLEVLNLLFWFVRYMSFKYLCHLNLHGGSQEVIAFSNLYKKHIIHWKSKTALKYELDV